MFLNSHSLRWLRFPRFPRFPHFVRVSVVIDVLLTSKTSVKDVKWPDYHSLRNVLHVSKSNAFFVGEDATAIFPTLQKMKNFYRNVRVVG